MTQKTGPAKLWTVIQVFGVLFSYLAVPWPGWESIFSDTDELMYGEIYLQSPERIFLLARNDHELPVALPWDAHVTAGGLSKSLVDKSIHTLVSPILDVSAKSLSLIELTQQAPMTRTLNGVKFSPRELRVLVPAEQKFWVGFVIFLMVLAGLFAAVLTRLFLAAFAFSAKDTAVGY